MSDADVPLHESINLELQKTIAKNMDVNIKPCADFYKYTCGNWWRHHDKFNFEETLKYDINTELIGLIEDSTNSWQNKPKFTHKVRDLFKSCMNSEEFISEYYMRQLRRLEGIDWALWAKNESIDDWVEIFAVATKYGMNDILLEGVIAPLESADDPSNVMTIHLRKGVSDYGFNEMITHDVRRLRDTMDMETDLMDYYEAIRNFEIALRELNNKEYPASPRQILEVKDLPIEWLKKYLEYIVAPDYALDPHMKVVVTDLDYLKALDALLMKTDKKFLRIYIEMRFLRHFYHNVRVHRKYSCLAAVRGIMPLAMHWIYEDMHHLDAVTVNDIQTMFTAILQQIYETLHRDRYGVVDAESLEKLKSMKLIIGNLPRHNTTDFLEEFYAPIMVKPQFYKNFLAIQKLQTSNMLKALYNRAEDNYVSDEFYDTFENFNNVAVNIPKYYPAHNVLLLPTYLLRSPLYQQEFEPIFKYSLLGSTLASAVFSTLHFNDFTKDQINTVIFAGSIRTSYDVFFSREVTLENFEAIDDLKKLSKKQLFLVNAMHAHCGRSFNEEWFSDRALYFPEFSKIFD
ncbi:membrane metallo-endopeptidase-like 1, partial [Musca vetustissima]|uniref:membrane metallo-endopeptidase-like 1 n=1 Tax=Musca vetustissima TaxID=27455 RepID=UPI002AB6FF9E